MLFFSLDKFKALTRKDICGSTSFWGQISKAAIAIGDSGCEFDILISQRDLITWSFAPVVLLVPHPP